MTHSFMYSNNCDVLSHFTSHKHCIEEEDREGNALFKNTCEVIERAQNREGT